MGPAVSGVLTPLLRAQRLELWIDVHRLQVGEAWREGIHAAITRARVALLLVSEDFLASRFINEHELPALINHGVRLAPVLVGDCLWPHVPGSPRCSGCTTPAGTAR